MIWRRVLVPSNFTIQQLHGILQVTMGWEGYHFYLFKVRAVEYGPLDLCVANPDKPLSDFEFRRNERFSYVYDMGDYWEHDIRVEAITDREPNTDYPVCTGGARRCPEEDSGGIEGHRFRIEDADGYDAWRDIDLVAGLKQTLLDKCDKGEVPNDDDFDEVEEALDRIKKRQRYLDDSFSRKLVNDLFKQGRHQKLIHQNTEVVFDLGGF